MTNPSALTISFLEQRPSTAAQTLAEMDSNDAAAFLDSIPPRIAVRSFAHMNSWSASGLIKDMNAPSAAAVLQELDYPAAAAILRLVDEAERSALLKLLPEKLRRDLKTSLSFPDDTVGAQMTTAVLSLTKDETAAVAIALLRKSSSADPEPIFLVDEEKRLIGTVSPIGLLKSSASTLLIDIAERKIASLSARARVSSIARHSAWENQSYLPVLSRKKQLIGALSRAAVRELGRPQMLTEESDSVSIFAAMAGAFYESAVGLGRLVADVDQPKRSKKQRGNQS